MIQLEPATAMQEPFAQIHIAPKREPLARLQLEISNSAPLQCRICLQQETNESHLTNPLIVPCKCTGSVSYVHVSCLSTWLLKSTLIKINLGPPRCEICLHPYSIDKSCRPRISFKDRKNDYFVVFLVCMCLLVVCLIGLPVVMRTEFIIPAIKFILLGVLVSIMVVMLVFGGVYFKEAFVEIRYDWKVLPYRQVNFQPTIISLVTQQPQTPTIKRQEEVVVPRWSSRSSQPTAGNIVVVHPS